MTMTYKVQANGRKHMIFNSPMPPLLAPAYAVANAFNYLTKVLPAAVTAK
jgi:hypothetical protein